MNIINFIKRIFGIQSPSKIYTDFGRTICFNFNLGFMKGQFDKVNYKNHKFILRTISAPKYKGIPEIEKFKREIEERE